MKFCRKSFVLLLSVCQLHSFGATGQEVINPNIAELIADTDIIIYGRSAIGQSVRREDSRGYCGVVVDVELTSIYGSDAFVAGETIPVFTSTSPLIGGGSQLFFLWSPQEYLSVASGDANFAECNFDELAALGIHYAYLHLPVIDLVVENPDGEEDVHQVVELPLGLMSLEASEAIVAWRTGAGDLRVCAGVGACSNNGIVDNRSFAGGTYYIDVNWVLDLAAREVGRSP